MKTENEFKFFSSIPQSAKGVGVAVILFSPQNGICLTKRVKDNLFGCPGGKAEESDFSLEDAIRRELFEEIGLKVEEERLHWIGYQQATTEFTDYTCWYFLVLKDGEKVENKEPSKHEDWNFYKLSEALSLPLFCGTRQTLMALCNRLKHLKKMLRDKNAINEIEKNLPLLEL